MSSIINEYNIYYRKYHKSIKGFPFEVARANERANNMSKFHWHDFLEITYIVSGEGLYHIEDKSIKVKEGDFLIINNYERHRVQYPLESPLYEIVLHFDPEILHSFLKEQSNPFNYASTMFYNKLVVDSEIQNQMKKIIEDIVLEFKEQKPYYELHITSLLTYFISFILRHSDVRTFTSTIINNRASNIARIENILKYLSKNIGVETNLKSVAKHFSLNPNYFSEYFKNMMGITFTDYLRELRISSAAQMIERGNKKIIDIAYDCGYNSISAFYEAFLKIKGIPPKQYKKYLIKNLKVNQHNLIS